MIHVFAGSVEEAREWAMGGDLMWRFDNDPRHLEGRRGFDVAIVGTFWHSQYTPLFSEAIRREAVITDHTPRLGPLRLVADDLTGNYKWIPVGEVVPDGACSCEMVVLMGRGCQCGGN